MKIPFPWKTQDFCKYMQNEGQIARICPISSEGGYGDEMWNWVYAKRWWKLPPQLIIEPIGSETASLWLISLVYSTGGGGWGRDFALSKMQEINQECTFGDQKSTKEYENEACKWTRLANFIYNSLIAEKFCNSEFRHKNTTMHVWTCTWGNSSV